MNAEKYELAVREATQAAVQHGVPFVNVIGILDAVKFDVNNTLLMAKIQRAQAQPKLVVPRGAPFPPPPGAGPNGGQA